MESDTIQSYHSRKNEHSSTRHLLVMLIGCLAMFAGLALLAIYSPSNSYLAFGLVLLCPLMHLWMMRNPHHRSSND